MNFFNRLKNNKTAEYIFLAILSLTIIAVFAFSLSGKNSSVESSDAVDVYVRDLEDRLSNTLSKVDGAGKVSVVITVNSGMETIIATEKTSVTENGKTTVIDEPILVNGKTVTLMEKYPKIIGVLIVAEGAKNITVMQKIQQATISLLNIELSQVEILTMK